MLFLILFRPCRLISSMRNLNEPTGLPQQDQNSDFSHDFLPFGLIKAWIWGFDGWLSSGLEYRLDLRYFGQRSVSVGLIGWLIEWMGVYLGSNDHFWHDQVGLLDFGWWSCNWWMITVERGWLWSFRVRKRSGSVGILKTHVYLVLKMGFLGVLEVEDDGNGWERV